MIKIISGANLLHIFYSTLPVLQVRPENSFVFLFSSQLRNSNSIHSKLFVTFSPLTYSIIVEPNLSKMETIHLNRALHPIFSLLRFTYGIVPIVAGLDKFTDLLTHWENYLHPGLAAMLPFNPHTFMMIVGVIEMIAGLLVLVRPAIGGYIVAAWLVAIALTLLAGGHYLDVAVRDIVMAIGAFSTARMAKIISQVY
jgi:uncharacterized membrane protein YphA (DoxX/SURF4 family)